MQPTNATARDLIVRLRYTICLLALAGCRPDHATHRQTATTLQTKIVAGARDQLGRGTRYDPRYYRIAYPNGDVPGRAGVCTDVVIRAYRSAGYDLQKLVHEDILDAPGAYPGVKRTDTSIDHRRVPNLMAFLLRHGKRHGTDRSRVSDWKPADVVWFKTSASRDHVGVLTDRRDAEGLPFVLHNVGQGPREEDLLGADGWKIVAHARYP